LYATQKGNVVKSLNSRLIHDFVLDKLGEYDKQNSENTFENRLQAAKSFVKKQVENVEAYPLYVKRNYTVNKNDFAVYNLKFELFTWFQQEDIYNFGMYFYQIGTTPQKVKIALWDGGTTVLHSDLDEVMDLCEQGYGVFVVDLTGTGTVSDGLYTPSKPDYYYTRMVAFCENLLVNGDNLPAMRVRGLCKAMDVVEQVAGKNVPISILTHGSFNLYAWMAKLIDSRIKTIDEQIPLDSIRKLAEKKYYNHNNIMAIAMPGILKMFDMQELKEFAEYEG
jgi:hypothetical protein